MKAAAAKKRVCKVCKELPLPPEDGAVDPEAEYRPKVDRPAPHPGPRCTTHNRQKKAADRLRVHGNRIKTIYGIDSAFYWALYELQGGRCFICRRATGRSKRLAVDHNHETGEVRGLLCKLCNRDVLGHLRDDIEAFRRAIAYLESPPARQLEQVSA